MNATRNERCRLPSGRLCSRLDFALLEGFAQLLVHLDREGMLDDATDGEASPA